ncbi:hypothetical protein K1720_02115 [Thermococcus argininiproducens]|uniref:Uncharacterized protein n=2 Tax=Thermococcus argininiproducens TaxID=2866384 RepID=A0A9E7MBI6_9EURY|nr:hypothetical protein [Thermococcus argininiproducens]USH00841.1 hypothetical protein K1720_02115 [Thermococcus argininiproducens]
MGFRAIKELSTKDGARIDLAILRGDEKILAIEFENSYKWIKQRILYNAIKAHRDGFKHLWVVYPFRGRPLRNSWVTEYITELGVKVEVVHPKEVEDELRTFLTVIAK